ncbi:MAG: sulfatase-like hydrolase/transferase [Desulfobacterales bacterium]
MKPGSKNITPVKQTIKALAPCAGLCVALIFLNALMNFAYPQGDNQIGRLLLISPEIFVIFILLGLAACLRLPAHPAVFWPLTLTVIFLRLFRLADGLVPAYFFRPFNLYLDSQFLPDLIFLLYSTVPLKTFALGSLLAVLALGLMAWCISRALKSIYTFIRRRRRASIFAATAALLAIMSFSRQPWTQGQAAYVFAPGILHRVAAEIDFILHLSDTTQKHQTALDQAVQKGRTYPRPLTKLNGSNVYVFFIESYGHTVFADLRHSLLITPHLKDAEHKLAEHGYLACSNFLKSPAYGGSSWLAHGALASGVTISSQLQYDLLLTSRVQPVAEYFNRAGYRTVSVMPGTLWPWAAGEFYKYRQKYYAPDFDYRGPKFGWAPMADQYVLDAIWRAEIQNRTRPLFIEFVMISSHAPFNELPHYLSDWSTIGDGSIYHGQDPIRFPIIWPDLENASEAYVTAIKYDWQVLSGVMELSAADDQIIIILGDHQPNLKITGENQPWSVPVHIISRNPDFVRPFIRKGYTPGLVPSQPLPHAGIESLLWFLLEEFS